MKKGKKKLRRSVGILLTLVLLCGILHGGSGLFGVVAQEEGAGDTGDAVPPGSRVQVRNSSAGVKYYSESLEEAFEKLDDAVEGSGEIYVTLLENVELEKCISVECPVITYLELNGHTITSQMDDVAFQMISGNFQVNGPGAIYTKGTAFEVSDGEISLGGDTQNSVYVYTQGDTGIKVTGGTIKLTNGCVSAGTTALQVEGEGIVGISSGALRAVSGSAIDASESTLTESNLLQSFLESYSENSPYYKGENGQPIELATDQRSIPGYCFVGDQAPSPTVTVELGAEGEKVYNGKEQTLESPIKVLLEGLPLGEGDYEVSYSNNLNAGTATVSVSCTGVFAPTIGVGTFEIKQATPKLSWKESSKVYNGNLTELGQELKQGLEVELVNGEEFSEESNGPIQYEYRKDGEETYTLGLPTDVGTYLVKAKISAKGNYTDGVTGSDLQVVIEEEPITEPTTTPSPTDAPSTEPTGEPTPTDAPSTEPTGEPSPTDAPSTEPTGEPTPTDAPSPRPTGIPSPTNVPSPEPTGNPTPTNVPSPEPTGEPTPTDVPSPEPTGEPTPTDVPSPEPTRKPSPAIENPDEDREDTDEPKRGEPFIRIDEDGNIKKGWGAVVDVIDRLEDGSSVVVDMNGAAVVPKDVLESIRDRDVTIVLDLGNGILWSICGEDITAEKLGDIDFSVQMGTNAIPVDVINTITGERYTIQVSLAYDGEFGLTATLTVALGSENAGYNASLYYYNPQTEGLEFITVVEIKEDGTASWKFTHASDYVIVVWEDEENGETAMPEDPSGGQDTSGTELPDTGMAWKGSQFYLIGMILAAAGFGMYCFGRRKKDGEWPQHDRK